MAFERAKIVIKTASVGTGIKVKLNKGKVSAAAMVFIISAATAKALEWSKGDKIEVLIGTDGDHGLLRVRKNNSIGQVELIEQSTAKGSWFKLVLGHQEQFVDRTEAAAWCQFETLADGFTEIVLPKWADETAPSRKAKTMPLAPISKQEIISPPAKSRSNVTADLMGDPPPNRRAIMDQLSKVKP